MEQVRAGKSGLRGVNSATEWLRSDIERSEFHIADCKVYGKKQFAQSIFHNKKWHKENCSKENAQSK